MAALSLIAVRRLIQPSAYLVRRVHTAPLRSTSTCSFSRFSVRPVVPKSILSAKFASTEGAVENASSHWKMERLATAALVGSVALGVIYPCPIADYSLALLLPLHAHWGLEQIVLDYIHGPLLHRTTMSLIYLFTFATIGGLLYFNYTDVGISEAVYRLYARKN